MPCSALDADELVRLLDLRPHPEGGWYRQTYCARTRIPAPALPPGFDGDRAFSTAIYYLLKEGEKSCLHRIRQDEVWHFYLGGPLRLVMIAPDDFLSEITLGQDILAGHFFQYTVPAGYWFGAAPHPGAGFCLVGCTVAPGFTFADFELGGRNALERAFPRYREMIAAFT